MGGNYEKSMYNQLMEVMAKLDTMAAEQKKDRKEIKSLTSEVTSLRKENDTLRKEVSSLRQENSALKEKCESLEKENTLLHEDNERLKRNANNNSNNSSIPPSKDQNKPPKAPNTYNSRKTTQKKPEPSQDIRDTACQKQMWKKKLKKDFLYTIWKNAEFQADHTSHVTGLTWMFEQRLQKSVFMRMITENFLFRMS